MVIELAILRASFFACREAGRVGLWDSEENAATTLVGSIDSARPRMAEGARRA